MARRGDFTTFHPLDFLLVGGNDLVFHPLPSTHIDRMGDVLKGPILSLPTGHGNKQPRCPFDDFQSAHNKSIVQGDAGDSLELVVIAQSDSDFGNVQDSPSP